MVCKLHSKTNGRFVLFFLLKLHIAQRLQIARLINAKQFSPNVFIKLDRIQLIKTAEIFSREQILFSDDLFNAVLIILKLLNANELNW